MSDSDRAAAREMIADSVDRNGNVNLKALGIAQNRWANEQKEHELSNTKNAGEIAGKIRDHYIHNIDRATKEVLGLIPESKWHYTDTVASNVLRSAIELFKADHPVEYVCEVPKNHEFNAANSLGSQNIQCHTQNGKGNSR